MPVHTPREYLSALEYFGIKLGLEQIRALLEALDHPDRAYPSLVIAGTNGKGSVTAMIERGLRAAGYRTGRYTSPHLVDIEERVAIDGVSISPALFDRAAGRVQVVAAALAQPPTFFEAATAIALDAFRDARVDAAVLEVGLGGRLDATNAVAPIGVAITSVDVDHQQYLGDTIEAIATEKAGVIKPGAIAVLGRNPPGVQEIVRAACRARGADYVYAPAAVDVDTHVEHGRAHLRRLTTARRTIGDVTLALAGRYQVDNAVTAVALLEALAARGALTLPDDAVRTALNDVTWPARLEARRWRGHDILIDGAHNPAGAAALASYLDECYGRRLPMVVGVMRDKDAAGILRRLSPAASAWLCTAPTTARALDPEELARVAADVAPDVPAMSIPTPADALERACQCGTPAVVAGSLYLAGEIRALTP